MRRSRSLGRFEHVAKLSRVSLVSQRQKICCAAIMKCQGTHSKLLVGVAKVSDKGKRVSKNIDGAVEVDVTLRVHRNRVIQVGD